MHKIYKIIVLIFLAYCHCNPIDNDSLILPEDSDATTGSIPIKRSTDAVLNFSMPDIKISEFPQFPNTFPVLEKKWNKGERSNRGRTNRRTR